MNRQNQTSGGHEYIPYHKPAIDGKEIKKVAETLKSGWLTTGPQTEEFERECARFVHAPFAVAVSSCTAALHLGLVAGNIGPGAEVITTPLTFAATAEVILHVGAKLILTDVEKNGFNLAPAGVKDAITEQTKAIIPVHFAGEPCNMDELLKLAKEHNILVIEDAAHALGASYKGRMIGNIGDLTAFSFYVTKNLTTGEGGMITMGNEALAKRIRCLSLHGLSKDAWKRYAKQGSWYYEIVEPGFKYNMSDVQAAIGLAQLEKFARLQRMRKMLVGLYWELLGDMEEIILPSHAPDVVHAWHLFVIRLHKEKLGNNRNEFIRSLDDNGIGSSVHFIPLHLHPYYRSHYGYKYGDLPNAESAYSAAISLPLYPTLSFSDVEYIAEVIRRIVVQAHKKSRVFVDNVR